MEKTMTTSDSPTAEYSGSLELEVMELAKNYNASIVEGIVSFFHRLRPGAAEQPRLMDFGAGNGFLANLVSERLNLPVLCLEPDEKLGRKIQARNSKLELVHDLSLIPDQSLDFIYSSNVLEHIEDDLGTLKTLAQKLRKGGGIFIYVPAFQMLYTSNDKLVGHVRRYKAGDLRRKLAEAGFTIDRLRYCDQVGFFAALAYKFLLDKGDGRINPGSLTFFDRYLFPVNKLSEPALGKLFGKNLLVEGRIQ